MKKVCVLVLVCLGLMIAPGVKAQGSNAELNGTYAFTFDGITGANGVSNGFAGVGSFTADGAGNLANGEADTNAVGGGLTAQPFTGTYSIGADHRGVMTFNIGGGTKKFAIATLADGSAKFIETDTSAILVGDAFTQQTSTCSWGNNALNGAIVFETAGTKSGAGITDLISFTADGTGVVTAESIDQNSGGTVTSPGSPLGGSYSIDACGRGILNIPATSPVHSYVFYMTSVGNALIQEVTSGTVAHGTMVQPQAGPFTAASLSGSYALNLAGTNAMSATTGN